MNVIIRIQERDAIPVRALPFVAGFDQFSLAPILSPYWIAMSAAMPNEPSIGNSLATFTIENEKVRQLTPNEWGAIIEQTDKPLNDAVCELPTGVFVFADEFAAWFKWMRQTDDQPLSIERFQINRNPLVPDALRNTVMDGFGEDVEPEATAIQKDTAQTVSDHQPLIRDQKIVVRKLQVMVDELCPIWKNIENDINNAQRNGLRDRAALPEHGLWNMAEALGWAFERRISKVDKTKAQRMVADEPTSELSILLSLLLK